MDYDDNDFKSQNFQLASEDSNKFPSSLRAFGLPKYDFDEHLHVHLRFDSLVDTEPLLGINCQGSNWIDDFSAGSSAIDFSSGAAESCSISWHNNVWSEATSSESVEMLLKSVGEDEMLDQQTTREEANAIEGLNCTDNQIGLSMGGDSPNAESSDTVAKGSILRPDRNTCSAITVEEMEDQHRDVVEGGSMLEHFDSNLGESLLPQKMDSESTMVQCRVGETSYNVTETCDAINEIQFDSDKQLVGGFMKSNLENSETFNERVAIEVHGSKSLHLEVCPSVVSLNDNNNNGTKLDAELFSEHVLEEHSAIGFSADAVLLPEEAEKQEAHAKNVEATYQCSEDHDVHHDHQHKEASTELEVKKDLSAPEGGCPKSFPPNNNDKTLESVHPHQSFVESFSRADEFAEQIHPGCPPTVALNRGIDDARKLSHLEVQITNTDASQTVDSQLNETVDVGDGHGEQRVSDKSAEKISETQGRGYQLADNAAGFQSSTEIALERPIVEEYDGFVFSQPISQNPESNYSGRYNTKNDDNKKAEPTPYMPKDDSCHVSMFPPEDSDVRNGIVKTSGLDDVRAHCNQSFAGVEVVDSLCKDEIVKKITEEGDWSSQKASQDIAEEQHTGVSSPIQGIVVEGNRNIGAGMGTSEISHIPSLASTKDAQHISELVTQSNSAVKDGSSSNALIHVDNRIESTEGAFCDDSKASCECSDDAVVAHTIMEPEPTCTGQEKASDAAESFLNKSQQSYSISESGSTLDHHRGGVGSNHGSSQPACGMMIVSGSSEYSKDEKGHVLETISNVTDDGKGDLVLHNSKHGASYQNGKSFALPVDSSLNMSKKAIGVEKRPLLNIQTVDFSQKQNEKYTSVNLKHEEGNRPETTSKKKDEKNISGSSTEKVKSSRRRSSKEPSLRKETPEKKGKVFSKLPLLLGPVDKDLQSGLMQNKHAYESNSRASCSPAVQKSGLPDLNSSVSPSALLHQPFTDFQQLQLRAQIFVYGSLIQGTPPDEACMISAFGGTDDGQNIWNAVWHAAVERFQNQKCPLNSSGSHILSRSGIRIAEPVTGCSTIQSKALNPPVSWSVSKVVSTVSVPSPLWSISNRDGLHPNSSTGSQLDFAQAVSPVYSYQATQINEHMGSGAARPSQASLGLGSPIVPSQSSKVDPAAYFSKFSLAETVRASSGRDTSTLSSSSMQIQPTCALLSSSAPAVEAENKAASTGIIKNQSNTPKSRKRKKAAVPEGPEVLLTTSPQAQVHPVSVTGVLKPPSAAPSLALEVNTPIKSVIPGPSPAATHNVSYNQNQIIGGVGAAQRAVLSDETCSRIEQAKIQAEDAAAHAASAVRHSQGIWSRLATQKISGIVLEVEEKLASAAVAAAAAASVAKAAAAAAKVASDAALQAKMMADEALSLVGAGSTSNNSDASLLDVGKSIASLTPVSILKSKDKTSVSSVALSAAKEVARKRVEAASTAAKRAENMNAIVKAAELAAEAVAQAGTIIAMGDPLPLTLNDLAEAGPEGYWRARPIAEHLSNRSKQHGMEEAGVVGQVRHEDSLKRSTELRVEHEIRIDDLPYQQSVGDEKAYVSRNDITENIIQKGALAEVVSDEDGLRGVWFSANVLDVKDGKAYVCYDDLLRDEGSDQLKEWIPLEEEGDKPPRIRIAHPMTQAGSGGTRKRRREALSNYTWAVGDRVDALIRDGWWEGIIMEKNEEDETKLTVYFPAGGDSAAVRAWNLRPSLFWKDGQWREWMRPRENSSHEGDTPQEKRQRVTRSAVNGGSKPDVERDDKQLKTVHTEAEESHPLPLSAKERVFTMGNNGSQANTFDARKMKRSGLQEGPRVVFGVPKPGKKRKFMAVSEHYVADKADKAIGGNDALKFAKYLMPQAPRSWRTTSKPPASGRGAGNSRLRPSKSVQSQSIRNRNLSGKDSSSAIAPDGEAGEGPRSNAFSNEENILKHNNLETGSQNSYGAADNAIQSSATPAPIGPSKKIYTSLGEEAGLKGKRSNIVGKSTKVEKTSEYSATTIPDTEPRRSNRRIQPTSRLLEGLQSSLLISKIPSVSHDKGSKVLHKSKSSLRGRVHG